MAAPLLADLLTVPSQDDALNQEVLPELQKRGVRTNDWIVGGVYRTMSYVVALMRVNARSALAALAAAGFEDYAFGLSAVPGGIDVTGWAPLIAKQRYGVDQIAATYTRRSITLTNSTATAYGPLQPGAIILSFPSGNRYVLDQVVTIPGTGSVVATFRSEFAANSAAGLSYTDPSGSVIAFVTSTYPGVTATNPSTTYGAITQTGSGVGLVTPTGVPTGGSHTVAVRIDASGTVAGATAAWAVSLDGGAFVPQSGYSNVIGSSITVTLTDNGGNPSFIVGAVYYFTTPGSDIIQVGRDVETPQALGARCRGLWPSLAFAKDSFGNWIPASPTASAYETLARSASSQVVIAFVQTGTINNQVKIYIAGQGSLLPGNVLTTVQAFFNAFTMLTDVVVVTAPTLSTITLGGLTITVVPAQMLSAQAALQRSLQLYFGGVDAKVPLSVNGRIDHAYLVSLIRNTPGVVKVSDTALTINGVAADLQLPVTPSAFEIASYTQTAATAFTWVASA